MILSALDVKNRNRDFDYTMSMSSLRFRTKRSRQMTNISRRYYERELGAGLGPSPSMKEHFGYSEPLRRFIQRESFEPQANEIPNNMPSWLPGDDYMTNFKVGDPYVRVDDGYARLPGAGYEALHPELKGLNPEDYPDIHKLRILSDVAPYSREYNQVSSSCLTQKPSRTRARHELRSRSCSVPHFQMALLFYASTMHSCGSSSLPHTKTLAHARQAEAPFTIWLSPHLLLVLSSYATRVSLSSSLSCLTLKLSRAGTGKPIPDPPGSQESSFAALPGTCMIDLFFTSPAPWKGVSQNGNFAC
jgi:hypothetical protein